MNQNELHERIDALLRDEVEANPVTYNAERPYQSYERVGFAGLRWSVEKRVREYGLDRFYDPDARILDIGSNFGFFVCEFALHCASAHGVEPNPHLNEIGATTAAYLGIAEKVAFFDVPFADFNAPHEYDVVLSLAAFFTADGRERTDASDYFGRVHDMLSPTGQVFYESTSYVKDPDIPEYSHYLAAVGAVAEIGTRFGAVEDWETPSGSEGYFRRFAIGTKI